MGLGEERNAQEKGGEKILWRIEGNMNKIRTLIEEKVLSGDDLR